MKTSCHADVFLLSNLIYSILFLSLFGSVTLFFVSLFFFLFSIYLNLHAYLSRHFFIFLHITPLMVQGILSLANPCTTRRDLR